MKFSKKTLGVITLASVLMFSSLTGCASKTSKTTGEDGVVNLTMWVHETDSPEGKLYKQKIEDFNKANDGKIKVELTAIPRTGDASGYDDKVNAAVTTNSLPDVLTVDGPTVGAQAGSGMLLPIDDYVDKTDLADFNKDIIQQATVGGKLYGLAAMDSSVLVYYNKDMFAKAGITAPTDSKSAWTFDELYENAKKLTTSDVNGIDLHLDWKGEWNTFAYLPLIQSNGGQIISDDGKKTDGSMNSDKVVQPINFVKKLVAEKIVTTTPVENSFEEGKAAMAFSGTWEPATLAKYPNLKWGMMPYPKATKDAKSVSPCGGWGFYMTKSATGKEKASVELIKYMTSTQSCIDMYKTNGMPPARQSAFDKIDEYKTLPMSIVADQLKNTAQTRPVTPDYPILTDQFSKAIANAINGMDTKASLDAASKQIDSQIGK